MDPAQMLLRCPHSPQRGTGWLEGWRLTFGGEDLGWDGALTTVVEDPAQRVFVALYDVPEVDEKELDSWDGVNLGFYSKIKVRVQALDGDVLAWLYVLDAYEGGLPSDRRLSILVDSAIKAGAPADYIDWLRGRPSNPPQLSSGLQVSAAMTRARPGTATAATAGQFQADTGAMAGVPGAATRACSTRVVIAATTWSASTPSGTGSGALADGAP
jgi:AIG2-like family